MEKLDKKTFIICTLGLSAVVLFVANMLQPHPANAQMAVKDRDYQAVTAHHVRGGDALYLTDNKTGKVAIYLYNTNSKLVDLKDVQPIMNAFAGGQPQVPMNKNGKGK